MGRPIKSKYFGTQKGAGTGGDSVAAVTVGTPGSYTVGTTATFAAPTNPGGTTATGTVVYEVISATISGGTGYGNAQTFELTVNTANGTAVLNVTSDVGGDVITVNSVTTPGTFTGISAVTSVSGGTGNDDAVPVLTYGVIDIAITNAGDGYSSAPAITFGGGAAAATAVLTSGSSPVIACTAFIPAANGGSSAVAGDIDEQVASKKYRVQTAQGTGPCTLVTAVPTVAGTMSIGATDSNGSTYFVKKLTARRAVLVQNVVNGSFVFATGAAAGWNLNAANSTDVVLDTM